MYDSNGSPIIAFQDKDLLEVFGTLNSKKRKQHHRQYLDKIDKDRLRPLINDIFSNDNLYRQYMRIVTSHYQKLMIGFITMNLIKASLLYNNKPQQQHYKYEGLLAVHILMIRRRIFLKIVGLRNAGYTTEDPLKTNIPKSKLIRMADRLANIIETDVYKITPSFNKAIEIDRSNIL